jgi:hypothetical protein
MITEVVKNRVRVQFFDRWCRADFNDIRDRGRSGMSERSRVFRGQIMRQRNALELVIPRRLCPLPEYVSQCHNSLDMIEDGTGGGRSRSRR